MCRFISFLNFYLYIYTFIMIFSIDLGNFFDYADDRKNTNRTSILYKEKKVKTYEKELFSD